jgi:hypothetical protein
VAPVSGPLDGSTSLGDDRPVRLPKSRLGWLATAPYFALLLAAIGYLIYRVVVAPASSELAAVPLVVLAFPWSILGISFGDSVGLWIGFISGVVLNATLCYGIGKAAEQKRRRQVA